jgi:hypothetical protein
MYVWYRTGFDVATQGSTGSAPSPNLAMKSCLQKKLLSILPFQTWTIWLSGFIMISIYYNKPVAMLKQTPVIHAPNHALYFQTFH